MTGSASLGSSDTKTDGATGPPCYFVSALSGGGSSIIAINKRETRASVDICLGRFGHNPSAGQRKNLFNQVPVPDFSQERKGIQESRRSWANHFLFLYWPGSSIIPIYSIENPGNR
jgi:hypothetical protein